MHKTILVLYAALVLSQALSISAKRGILFPWDTIPGDLAQFNQQNCPKARYYANWESWPHREAPRNLEFMAMARTPADIDKLYQFMGNNNAKTLLLFNEPDLPGPTQLNVETAVQLWRQHAVHFRNTRGVQLASPAITSDRSRGLPWLRKFMEQTRDVPPNYITLHYYGSSGTDFKNYVRDVYNEFRLPIIIHEVASTDSNTESVKGFMWDVTTWCEQQTYIKAVFWFCASRTANIKENLASSAMLYPNGQRTDSAYKFCYDW